MSAQTILALTLLTALLVVALALLAGSLAVLLGSQTADSDDAGSLTQAFRELDRQWRIERIVYRHHRIFGLAVVAAALACGWQLIQHASMTAPSQDGGTAGWPLLFDLLLAGQGFNLIVGGLVFIRPSLLKPLEAAGNRWRRVDAGGPDLPPKARALTLLLVAALAATASAMLLWRMLGA